MLIAIQWGQTSLGFNQLPATASNLVITTPRTSRIFFLLKIHKPNNPGRPIVPAYSCPTEFISILLDKIVAPVVRSLPSHIKHSRHALKILRDFNFLGEDKLIVPVDISGLQTSFDSSTVKDPSSKTLLRLAELVLTLDCFSIADSCYKEINGVAMGSKMGPSYANHFEG